MSITNDSDWAKQALLEGHSVYNPDYYGNHTYWKMDEIEKDLVVKYYFDRQQYKSSIEGCPGLRIPNGWRLYRWIRVR